MSHSRKSILKNRSPSDSNSPMRSDRNAVMYDKIVNLKSKLANFNNNSVSINKPGTVTSKKSLNNTCIVSSPSAYEMNEERNDRNFNFDSRNRLDNSMNTSVMSGTSKVTSNQPIMSKINELKKKWNEVSSKNKNVNNIPSSPNRIDDRGSIDESTIFSSNTNSDLKMTDEKNRYIPPKIRGQPGKR